MSKLVPLENRIVVAPDEEPEMSEGGVYLPDSSRKEQQRQEGLRGTVVAVGTRRIEATGERCDSQVCVGHHVLFGKYSGTEVKVDGEPMLILREDDILAIIAP